MRRASSCGNLREASQATPRHWADWRKTWAYGPGMAPPPASRFTRLWKLFILGRAHAPRGQNRQVEG